MNSDPTSKRVRTSRPMLCAVVWFMLVHLHYAGAWFCQFQRPRMVRQYRSKSILLMNSNEEPKSPLEQVRGSTASGALGALSILLSSQAVNALASSPVENSEYKKALWNIQSDDFWYPPFLIGRWSASLKFTGAQFTKKVPLETLAQNENLPGFSKYSVIFAPDLGQDIKNVTLRWAQIDSHPREDHPHNIRQLVKAFVPDARVDSAPYVFQKAPDWFHSPANQWTIKYHDSTGEGVVVLNTLKRDIEVFADTVETIEYFRQVIKLRVVLSYLHLLTDNLFFLSHCAYYRHTQGEITTNQWIPRQLLIAY